MTMHAGEINYHTIFDNADDAMILWEHQPGTNKFTVMDVNYMACNRYGYSREAFIGLDGSSLNTMESMIQAKQGVYNLNLSKRGIFELTHITKDGKLIPVESNAHQFRMNNRVVVLSICRDISERKRRERENMETLVQTLVSNRLTDLLTKIEQASLAGQYKFGEFMFSPNLKNIIYKGKSIALTPMESSIFRYLLSKSGRVVSLNELASQFQRTYDQKFVNNIRIHIYNLRKKIELNPQNPAIIRTKEGKGYIFSP
ncbi:MAG: hypothetical protein LLF82_000199 [Dehalococcoides mccartyi]|uniref:winged helix-turn-helix domain-containing protein n=1 Tax=Dehalococcoides mccartyi TaxID=61435 RepID=UPI002430026B|nr:winged helix-turn-helix domain-containing protein [Dehalococcoides mccartyi]MCF7634735.1 hypothetical protein [Dehalococcoides mccartyi]